MASTNAFSKKGWRWTRKGWKRVPKLQAKVKKVAPKRRPIKRLRSQLAEAEKQPTFATARKLAPEKIKSVSAPTPAAASEAPASRPPRNVWGGKYDALTRPEAATSPKDEGAP